MSKQWNSNRCHEFDKKTNKRKKHSENKLEPNINPKNRTVAHLSTFYLHGLKGGREHFNSLSQRVHYC